MKEIEKSNPQAIEALYDKISMLIESARRQVATTINVAMVYTNYEIGRYIVEDEQQGAFRAEYGKSTLKELSNRLSLQFGNGYSYPNLKRIRQFYIVYSKKINSVEPIALCLPNKSLLQRKLKEWIEEFEDKDNEV